MTSKADRDALRAEFDQEMRTELDRVGVTGFDQAAMWRRWQGRLPRPTCYRWMDSHLEAARGERPVPSMADRANARHHPDRPRALPALAAAPPPSAAAAPAARAAAAPAAALPGPSDDGDLAGAGIPIIQRLMQALEDMEQVRGLAFGADQKLRNPRLMVLATDAVRKTLETCLKVQERLYEVGRVERFHRAIIEELKAESPELAGRVVARLKRLAMEWGG